MKKTCTSPVQCCELRVDIRRGTLVERNYPLGCQRPEILLAGMPVRTELPVAWCGSLGAAHAHQHCCSVVGSRTFEQLQMTTLPPATEPIQRAGCREWSIFSLCSQTRAMADSTEERLLGGDDTPPIESQERDPERKESGQVYTRYLQEFQSFAKGQKATFSHASVKPYRRPRKSCWSRVTSFFVARIGEDWLFLLVLGLCMALLSFFVDFGIEKVGQFHVYLYHLVDHYPAGQFFVWVLYPLVLVLFAVAFTYHVAPSAAGSGIPEMKSVLLGVDLPDYLSMKALVAKSIGLVAALGSGIPIGKEGPFVHMASILGHNLSKILTNINTIYLNESRASELLAAACAVGVSSNFAAPIGGVLFSIEVTSTYFAVRNYWRGFFASICSAFVFRVLTSWINNEASITTIFATHFRQEGPFNLPELIAHVVLGVFCGLLGALFVKFNRSFVLYRRRKAGTGIWKLLDANRYVFPTVWVVALMSLHFPLGLGKYIGGESSHKNALHMMLSNITWYKAASNPSAYPYQQHEADMIVDTWATHTNLYLSLVLFLIVKFITAAISVTLPLPSGVFLPVFLLGATFGRLLGELTVYWYPQSLIAMEIVPGGYAVVGAAAFAGAVTHTISTAVIVFELTGQLTHIIPVMLAVLVANGVAQQLQPSIYDSGIILKNLPFIPDLKRSRTYATSAGEMMRTNLFTVSYSSTYGEILQLLKQTKYQTYPLVDSPDSMVLLGSLQRSKLQQLLHEHIWEVHIRQSQTSNSSSISSSRQSLDCFAGGAITPPHMPALEEDDEADDVIIHPAVTLAMSGFNTEIHEDDDKDDAEEEEGEGLGQLSRDIPPRPASGMSLHRQLSDQPQHFFRHSRSRSPSVGGHEPGHTWQTRSLPRRFSMSERPKSMHECNAMPRESLRRSSSASSLMSARLANERLIQSARQSITSINGLDLAHLEERVASRPKRLKRSLSRRVSQVTSLLLPSGEDQAEQLETLTNQLMDACVSQDNTVMDVAVDLICSQIDPSPFQVVETTNLCKIHTLFSLLALNHMYVTSVGRLVGVITLEELRNAVDGLNRAAVSLERSGSAMTMTEELELTTDVALDSPTSLSSTNPFPQH